MLAELEEKKAEHVVKTKELGSLSQVALKDSDDQKRNIVDLLLSTLNTIQTRV